MKKIYSSVLITLLLVSVFAQERIVRGQIFEEVLPDANQIYFVQGEFLVKFKPNVSEQTINALNSSHVVSTIYTSPYAGFRRLTVPNGETVASMIKMYQENADVEYAEANYIAYALKVPNDELYSHQWHLYNSSNSGINAESVWTISTSTGSGVVIAILDTGIAYENYSEINPAGSNISYQQAPDLVGTIFVPGYDFVNNDEHPNDDSVSGHGTHIAGIIAENTHNSIGTAGVAFDAHLMPVKVLDYDGAGTYANIAEGIIWATENGAHVINLGFGGIEPSIALEEAIAYAYNHGLTIIAAAGNDSTGDLCYPAAYDDYVIAVGATRYDDTLAYYSNHGDSLDLVAPGGDLNVDQNGDGYGDGILQQTYKISEEGEISWGYSFMEGTSMAAAHVSGVAALLIANGNASSPAEVRLALESTAKDKGVEGWDIRYGWGIVDAFAALQWTASEPEPILESQALQAEFTTETSRGYTLQAMPLILVANFTAKPRSGISPLTVRFTDTSIGNISRWLWNFGDGTTSMKRSPSHVYHETGSYKVSLTIIGRSPGGSDTETKSGYIRVTLPPPVANFTAKPRSGDGPLVVQFTDTSTGHVSSRLWDFGDGTTSTIKNPIHTYTYRNNPDYTVSLRVTDMGSTDIETKTNYIHLNAPLVKVNMSLSKRGVFRNYYEVITGLTVTHNDPTRLPIAGVSIEGTWSGAYSGSVSGITNANGGISFSTDWVARGSTVTFTINKVIIGSKEYDFTGTKSASIGI